MTFSLTNYIGFFKLVGVTLLIGFFLLAKCKNDNDYGEWQKEFDPTKAAMAAMFHVERDTTSPQIKVKTDSIKLQQQFIQKFNDTASIKYFMDWIYKNVSAQQNDQIRNTLTPFFNAYLTEQWKKHTQQPKK